MSNTRSSLRSAGRSVNYSGSSMQIAASDRTEGFAQEGMERRKLEVAGAKRGIKYRQFKSGGVWRLSEETCRRGPGDGI